MSVGTRPLGLMNCNIQLTIGSDQVGTGVSGKATKVLLETRQSNCSTNKCAVVESGVCGCQRKLVYCSGRWELNSPVVTDHDSSRGSY